MSRRSVSNTRARQARPSITITAINTTARQVTPGVNRATSLELN